MSEKTAETGIFRVADLPQNRETPFDLRPDSGECEALARDLGLLGLRKLRLSGVLRALGKSDWEIEAMLGATVVQPCVVSLVPVTTRLDVPVARRFLAQFDLPQASDEEDEVEIPEDEDAEPLGTVIDVRAVMHEALALNLPLYPRAEDAEVAESLFTEPGKKAMTDEDTRPFAGLAGLRDKLADKDKK